MRERILGYLYALGVAASSAFPFQVLGLGLDTHEFAVGPILDGKPTNFAVILCIFVVLAFVSRIVARLLEAVVAPVRGGPGELLHTATAGTRMRINLYRWEALSKPTANARSLPLPSGQRSRFRVSSTSWQSTFTFSIIISCFARFCLFWSQSGCFRAPRTLEYGGRSGLPELFIP